MAAAAAGCTLPERVPCRTFFVRDKDVCTLQHGIAGKWWREPPRDDVAGYLGGENELLRHHVQPRTTPHARQGHDSTARTATRLAVPHQSWACTGSTAPKWLTASPRPGPRPASTRPAANHCGWRSQRRTLCQRRAPRLQTPWSGTPGAVRRHTHTHTSFTPGRGCRSHRRTRAVFAPAPPSHTHTHAHAHTHAHTHSPRCAARR